MPLPAPVTTATLDGRKNFNDLSPFGSLFESTPHPAANTIPFHRSSARVICAEKAAI
jgi:hypothetical protein